MSRVGEHRTAVVGSYSYFENHFPEGWQTDPSINCYDVSGNDFAFLVSVANFRPHLTIFYRPELYPAPLVESISGYKVAFLSEPVPALIDGSLEHTHETEIRMGVYSNMPWHVYDHIVYYDDGKRESVSKLGWPVDEFRMLSIDTSIFRPRSGNRPIDVFFIGKPTERRIKLLDCFRYWNLRFVWVAHGVTGRQLARLFQRSKVVLNVHADPLPALEPRVSLAASCGCAVMTEDLGSDPELLREHLVKFDGQIHRHDIETALALYDKNRDRWIKRGPLAALSIRSFIDERMQNLSSESRDV